MFLLISLHILGIKPQLLCFLRLLDIPTQDQKDCVFTLQNLLAILNFAKTHLNLQKFQSLSDHSETWHKSSTD